VFGTILLTATVLLHLYVFWRASTMPVIARRVRKRYVVGAGLAIAGVQALFDDLGHGGSGSLAAVLELIGMSWLTTLFLVTVVLLAVDVVTVFGLLLRKAAPLLRGWALVAGAALAVFAHVQGMRAPVVVHHEIELTGLPASLDGVTVVAISDLHAGNLLGAEWVAARVAQVNALRPDVIVVLGDVLEGHGEPLGELIAALGGLRARLGVWGVTGNHEGYGRREDRARAVELAGIAFLHDSWVEVTPGLVLAGVDDLTRRRRTGESGTAEQAIDKALAGRPPGATVLLSHTPWHAERAARGGAGLMLSGHTHDGQVWPFGYLVKTVYPLLGGRYDVNGMPVIVCRGTGTWGPPMRLWRPSEILHITLRSKT
jgi:predicted MPP superfamily phosphohydrolase